MKLLIVAVLALALVSCEGKQLTYLGEITDFSIHMGSFSTAGVSVVQISDGRKFTVRCTRVQTGQHLYRDNRGRCYVGWNPPTK